VKTFFDRKTLKAIIISRYFSSLYDSGPALSFRLFSFILLAHFFTPSKMVKLPTNTPSSSNDSLEQEWEEARDNFIEFEDYETRLHRLRSELPFLDILKNRDLTSKIRLMERRKRKWLAIMHGLTRLIEKRA
jgi:hypothetical protein